MEDKVKLLEFGFFIAFSLNVLTLQYYESTLPLRANLHKYYGRKKSEINIVDNILKRPGMYIGLEIESMDSFTIFINSLSVGLEHKEWFSEEEIFAISSFGSFMRYFLHGENKNCCWQYDLLSRFCNQKDALVASKLLYLPRRPFKFRPAFMVLRFLSRRVLSRFL